MVVILLPNQLFEDNKILEGEKEVYIIEHPVYFSLYEYHKMKLVLHRASMKKYVDYVKKEYKINMHYIEYNDNYEKIFKNNSKESIKIYDPVDHGVLKEFKQLANKHKNNLEIIDNPSFLCNDTIIGEYMKEKGSYFHHVFYTWCRKKFDILMNGDKPIGGRWSYDDENRLPFPKGGIKDQEFKENKEKYVEEAKRYVERHFNKNVGETELYLPIDSEGAKKQYKKFIKSKLKCFGPYEDAVSDKIMYGCHSVLSPLINIGLITAEELIRGAEKHRKTAPIQSIEAYIRQIFWREYCMFVYKTKHKELVEANHFGHKRKLGEDWYTGETAFNLINDLIKKALKLGYCHHIERLMYLGNMLLISEINPKDVYEWYMIMFIDAYNWVMEPNVYGMSQHSAGPIMMKRPYFSSSNYIDKMSNYKRGGEKIKIGKEEYEWNEIWDALYYNFINNNLKEFSKNYSTATMTLAWKRKKEGEKKEIIKKAEEYLRRY
jgi:deoxyribodipyrimidine photolyase-related protein